MNCDRLIKIIQKTLTNAFLPHLPTEIVRGKSGCESRGVNTHCHPECLFPDEEDKRNVKLAYDGVCGNGPPGDILMSHSKKLFISKQI